MRPEGSQVRSRWAVATWQDGERVPLHAREAGSPDGRPPVALVHGQVVSSRYLTPLLRVLGPYRHALAPDLPGFGRSGKPRRVLDVEGLAESLRHALDAFDVGGAHLFGNSMGCQVIAAFAERYPDRCASLTLQGPTADPAGRTAWEQTRRWLVDSTREPPNLAPVLVRDYLDAGFQRFVGTFRALLDDAIEQRLPRIRPPTLVVRGGRDAIVPACWAEEAARLLPRGELATIPCAAHTLNWTAPQELASLMLPFMERAEGGAIS